jgi:serine/threonine protein phosphatase PrpC/peptidoglycan hydrolase-like protein with peptidoglycan-binding domain
MKDWTLDYGNHWHKGARKEQQDYFASSKSLDVVASKKGFLAVIADGMGGHTGGGSASVIAVKTFMEEYEKQAVSQPIPDALNMALMKANAAVVNENRQAGGDMGTTLIGCVLQSNRLYWISVGDSALFIYQNGQLKRKNADHSYGAELDLKVKTGQISPQQADLEQKKRNMLTSYLGLERIPQTDISREPVELKPGEKVLLCTDGLINAMSDSEISLYLKGKESAQEKCELLTQQTLKKQKPRQDNITTVLLELKSDVKEQTYEPPKPSKKRSVKQLILAAGIALLILAVLVAAAMYFKVPDKLAGYFPGTASEQGKKAAAVQKKLTEKTDEDADSTEKGKSDYADEMQGNETDRADGIEKGEFDVQSRPCKKTWKDIQEILKAMNLYEGKPSGEYDTATKTAISKFQFEVKLPPTGQMDDKTCDNMLNPCGTTWNEIQRILKDMKIGSISVYEGSEDGIFTDAVREAIEKFQKRHHIGNEKGIIDKETCSMLKPCGATWSEIQRVLKNIELYNDEVDGQIGPNTERAIKAFQKRYGFEETGKLNDETCEKLKPGSVPSQ